MKASLSERGLMEIWDPAAGPWEQRRKEIVKLLCSEVYGTPPPAPDQLSWRVAETDPRFCAGKATFRKIMLTAQVGEKAFTFPVYSVIPNARGKHPFFIHINFRDHVPDKYMPSEEICDHGYAVLSFCYQDVATDDADFSRLLAEILVGPERGETAPGKLALWSWAASRVMDYAQTLPELDSACAAVAGHSRLGKTALLTGALDERFAYVFSNNSGCTGAALSRGNRGETVGKICEAFPFWFCKAYLKYAGHEADLPFDQHFLLAATAPRKVYAASARDDLWADPVSEFLSCAAAGEVYEKLGLQGLICPDRLPEAGDAFHEGSVGYHLRAGTHYFGREDWRNFIRFIDRHRS